jgi:hypothetical protein
MYVLVQHYVSDPQVFWSDVRAALSVLPPHLRLHHVYPTPDGSHAVCLWEAESVRDVKAFIEAYVGHVSRNLYFQVENRAGIATPSEVESLAMAGRGHDGRED